MVYQSWNTLCYLMFLAISGHTERSVGKFVWFALLGFQYKSISPSPELPINDRLQCPALIGSIANNHAAHIPTAHVAGEGQQLKKGQP